MKIERQKKYLVLVPLTIYFNYALNFFFGNSVLAITSHIPHGHHRQQQLPTVKSIAFKLAIFLCGHLLSRQHHCEIASSWYDRAIECHVPLRMFFRCFKFFPHFTRITLCTNVFIFSKNKIPKFNKFNDDKANDYH